jgi:hypothetical protein
MAYALYILILFGLKKGVGDLRDDMKGLQWKIERSRDISLCTFNHAVSNI